MDLKNKTVLVTGASSGIGKAIAIEFARAGAIVLSNYRKDKAGAEDTLTQVNKSSTGGIYQANMSDAKAVGEMFGQIQETYKTVDILINNAGDAKAGKLDDMEMWDFQMKSILFTAVNGSNEFLKQDKTTGLRKIINISSVYGGLNTGNDGYISYSASKAALNSVTKTLAKQYAPKVLINAVAPGYTWTPHWEGTPGGRDNDIKDSTKIKRFIEPEEIAEVVIMLATNDAITGEIISVDGGLNLVDMD